MPNLTWECPACKAFIESLGRDESSRNAVKTFKNDHGCTTVRKAA